MKTSAILACCAIVAALALLAACQPDVASETDSCMECHSGDTVTGNAVLAAQAQYENSGHFQGHRSLDPFESTTGHNFISHGSNAMYTNGSNCSKCHTHQGFVDFIAAGMPSSWNQSYGAASQPGCFTCHEPHLSGDFSMRKETPEILVDGTTEFNKGKGNLCVTCHKSLTASGTFLSGFTGSLPLASATKSWSSSTGPHHGPEADFIMGVNHYAYAAKDYSGTSPHLALALPDACVSCHMYQPGARLGGNLQLGGHGWYLTGDVHGSIVNVIGVTSGLCRSCHGWSGTGATVTVPTPGPTSGYLTGGYETSSAALINTYLDQIRANRDILISYFGTGTNFYKTNVNDQGTPADTSDDTVIAGAAGDGPIESLTGGDATSGEWEKDWAFAASRLTEAQSRAFWNFRYFIEDKSQGIHNPVFAIRILWDSVEGLGLTPNGSRP